MGAVLFNGGIAYHANVFANSYSVPGPDGVGNIYYDKSVPMPPAIAGPNGGPPALRDQWHQQTRWLKLFLVLLGVFWLLQWIIHWKIALFLPILFIPTILLSQQWRRHYAHVELYLLLKLYATAFVPGALVVMLVETVVTIIFAFICFQSALSGYLTPGQTPGPTDKSPHDKHDNEPTPAGMEFLNYSKSPALFVFLFLLSYGSAGCVEESLKYWCRLVTHTTSAVPSHFLSLFSVHTVAHTLFQK